MLFQVELATGREHQLFSTSSTSNTHLQLFYSQADAISLHLAIILYPAAGPKTDSRERILAISRASAAAAYFGRTAAEDLLLQGSSHKAAIADQVSQVSGRIYLLSARACSLSCPHFVDKFEISQLLISRS
jgi:hypothetical protein